MFSAPLRGFKNSAHYKDRRWWCSIGTILLVSFLQQKKFEAHISFFHGTIFRPSPLENVQGYLYIDRYCLKKETGRPNWLFVVDVTKVVRCCGVKHVRKIRYQQGRVIVLTPEIISALHPCKFKNCYFPVMWDMPPLLRFMEAVRKNECYIAFTSHR